MSAHQRAKRARFEPATSSGRMHVFEASSGSFVLEVATGNLFPVPRLHAAAMRAALQSNDAQRAEWTACMLGMPLSQPTPKGAPYAVRPRALSLAIAQQCNLGCTYCYAEEGTFGGSAKQMTPETARAAVDRLIADAEPNERLTLAFMGGEPLLNREAVHGATSYAAEKARARGVDIGFSITTNATKVTDADIDLFDQHGFVVTVSLDGDKESNDRTRPFRSGEGSFDRVARQVTRMTGRESRRFQVLARGTVTPKTGDLPRALSALLGLGFDTVTFSPMLSSPSGSGEMNEEALAAYLEQLKLCANGLVERLESGQATRFGNLDSTLQRIRAYEPEEYPCGAGGGYLGVSADGDLAACHRFVEDEEGQLGNVRSGIDTERQSQWLRERHLDSQAGCTRCWARHLCAGSCHYEVLKRGRPACDFIRSWLDYCLGVYADLMRRDTAALADALRSR